LNLREGCPDSSEATEPGGVIGKRGGESYRKRKCIGARFQMSETGLMKKPFFEGGSS
jgi:hypothetical protein